MSDDSDSNSDKPKAVRVLVVEDDPDIQAALAELLQDEGYIVDTASNGRSALRYLENGYRPDVILLDLMMPVLNGWDVRRAQLADPSSRHIPVVLLSAGSNLSLIAAELHTGYHMKKPYDPSKLLVLLREIADGPPASLPGPH